MASAPDGALTAGTFRVLHNFNQVYGDGFAPESSLILDANGNLYGTTVAGGIGCDPPGCGIVFGLKPNSDGSWSEAVLHNFHRIDGAWSYAPLVFDRMGNLYGTTRYGGSSNGGTVFELIPGGDGTWREFVLQSFNGDKLGSNPVAGVMLDDIGHLYGTSSTGAINDAGAVFGPGVSGTCMLHDFGREAAGNLYGTTFAGGTSDLGTAFKLSSNADGSWTETILHTFTGQSDGSRPYGALTFDRNGNLYGTTNTGGPNRYGTVFKMRPMPNGQWIKTVLYGFSGRWDGGWPGAGVILDGAGNIYGTAVVGGMAGDPDHSGVVFEITP